MIDTILSRRRFLGFIGTGLLASGNSRLSFAAGLKDRPLVVILLRGGLDGHALLPLHGSATYSQMRGPLALPAPGADQGILDLDGTLGLHPAAQALFPYWAKGQLAVAPAVSSPYRGMSHAAAQRVMDSGIANADANVGVDTSSGWLNRAIAATGSSPPASNPLGVAVGAELPLLLKGAAATTQWSPPGMPEATPGFLTKAATLYANDPYFAQTLTAGMQSVERQRLAWDKEHLETVDTAAQAQDLIFIAERVGQVLADPGGPGVAVIELGGWDSHDYQGSLNGPLARRIASLADGIAALAEALNPVWKNSIIVTTSEFGRSITPNPQHGTDPGGAGAALIVGGALSKSQRLGDIPEPVTMEGHAGAFLSPTLDSRAVFKGILAHQWGLSRSVLDKRVFPESTDAAPVEL